ncbi:hypothetical protein RDABS01_008907 [Bienertia sinuspersici]
MCVTGVFRDPLPPMVPLVQTLINSQWEKRNPIRVSKTSIYYIFECMHPRDNEALIRIDTTVLDGKVITFRDCDWYTVPSHLNLSTMRFWVRISGLPFGYLDTQWAQNILGHVGLLKQFKGFLMCLPMNPEFRVLVWINTIVPLILSCYLPLFEN